MAGGWASAMTIIYFFYGLSFGGLGLAASLQLRRGGDLPLRRQLPWLAAFGFAYAATGWLDMFLASGMDADFDPILKTIRMVLQPASGMLLLIFGWGVLTKITPLPAWTHLVPGLLIAPIAFVIAYAATTFITPSPLEIPIDIWSRYLLYLPGSIMAGIGFLRQWWEQNGRGLGDVAGLMLAAGLAFLFEAFVVGLVVPAAPHAPASYYNYNRSVHDAFSSDESLVAAPYGLAKWLDYEQVRETTGLPIQFWRMVSAFAVTLFVVRGLDVFDAIRKRELQALQDDRDRARQAAFEAQITAREVAESWTNALIGINRRIAELSDVDDILLHIVATGRELLSSDFVGLALLNAEMVSLELKCYANSDQAAMVDEPIRVENPLIVNSWLQSRPYLSTGQEGVQNFTDLCFFTGQTARATAVVHLNLDENPIGVLWIARFEALSYTETDLIWLECLADQVVIAIQHGLMTAQMQSYSIIEERGRIAREMHDGLAQVLGYLNLEVQTLETLLKREKWEALQAELDQMRQAVQLAHADVRENILSLRTTLAHEKGLASAIDEYLNEFGIQTRINTAFENEVNGSLNISSIAEVQLVCILQEALANVRKHAQATAVTVRMTPGYFDQGEYLQMVVSDDGVGFETQNGRRTFGLQTMHERAQAVGGELVVRSAAGQGTAVICRLPCLPAEKLSKHNRVFQ
jgi:signal transduction histidine kinase